MNILQYCRAFCLGAGLVPSLPGWKVRRATKSSNSQSPPVGKQLRGGSLQLSTSNLPYTFARQQDKTAPAHRETGFACLWKATTFC